MTTPDRPGLWNFHTAHAGTRTVTVTEERSPPAVEAQTGEATRLRGKLPENQHSVLLSCFGPGEWDRVDQGETR